MCSQNIRLHFLKFDIEDGSSLCPRDNLKVYDGHNSSGTLRGTYCGSTIPADIVSKGTEMFVTFRTDHKIVKSGFQIRFSVGKHIFQYT